MTFIESIGWHLLGLVLVILFICLLVKNLNESRMNKLINFINKTLPNTPLTPMKPAKPLVSENTLKEPPSQFMLGMDVKQWTDKFLFYLKENKIEHNKNELLLSKLEPFCLTLIDGFKFSSDTDIAFEQHIMLMNRLFQLKKKSTNNIPTIPAINTTAKKRPINQSVNNQRKNLRVLIPELSLNLNLVYK